MSFRQELTGKTNVSALHSLFSTDSTLLRCRDFLGFALERSRGRSHTKQPPFNELHVNANSIETITIGRTVQNAEIKSTILNFKNVAQVTQKPQSNFTSTQNYVS